MKHPPGVSCIILTDGLSIDGEEDYSRGNEESASNRQDRTLGNLHKIKT